MARFQPTIEIIQSGSPGNYSYTVAGSDSQGGNCPINYVTWGDAARFCNWLQNGQPTGSEGPETTETGAYTLNGDTTSLMEARNPNATYFIPSVNEWYKAAYYMGGGTNAGYWNYATQTNTAPVNTLPDTGNHANFYDEYGTGNGGYTDPTNHLTPVGSFVLSPGPYGTYDMGGDVSQWTEGEEIGEYRYTRGGGWGNYSSDLVSSNFWAVAPTELYGGGLGFRVASTVAVPEPD